MMMRNILKLGFTEGVGYEESWKGLILHNSGFLQGCMRLGVFINNPDYHPKDFEKILETNRESSWMTPSIEFCTTITTDFDNVKKPWTYHSVELRYRWCRSNYVYGIGLNSDDLSAVSNFRCPILYSLVTSF